MRTGGKTRQPGDNAEMVQARHAFLATGAFERISDRLNDAVRRIAAALAPEGGVSEILDVGCGEGYYTRRLAAALGDAMSAPARIAGVDVSRPAISIAAQRHRRGWYAVGSAFELPVPPASVDIVVSVFGPIAGMELARILRPSGAVIAVHPGPGHLYALRQLVYEEAVPHEVKDPLRAEATRFRPTGSRHVTYPLHVSSVAASLQLLAMTPYRWHAGRDIDERLEALGGLATEVDVVLSIYEQMPSG
jgi:23S rRNA (guanine745-N1)-methyltransferase